MNRMALLPTDPIQFPYSSADIQSVSKGLAVAKNMDAFRGKTYFDNSGNQVTAPSGAIDLGRFRGAMPQQAYVISPASTFQAMKCIAYANGVWLIGGARAGTSINNILRSTDGFTWTAVNTPTAVGNASVGFVPTGFAYGNSIWVACGNYSNTSADDVIIKSTDNGLTWTRLGNPFSSTNTPYAITYGNKWVVASEYLGTLQLFVSTSTTASTWYIVLIGANSYRPDISSTNLTYLNNPLRSYASFILSVKKVVSGVVGDCQLLTSTDGITWTEVTTPPGIITIYSITMGGAFSNTTTFYISAKWKIGNTYYFGHYLYFFDGQVFSYVNYPYSSTQDFTTKSSIIKGGKYFILTGGLDSRSFYIELDNIAYNETYRSTYGEGQSIAYGNNMFIQVNGGSSMMIINPAKAVWGDFVFTAITENPFSGGIVYKVAWNGSYFLAVGRGNNSSGNFNTSAATSSDGFSWVSSNPFGITALNVAWNGSYWIALTSPIGGKTIFKSSDAVTWTASNNDPFSGGAPSGIAWNGSYWLAVCTYTNPNNSISQGILAKSLNGMDWTSISLTQLTVSIAWNGSYWLIGCTGNSINIIKSSDGVSWTPSANNPFQNKVNIIVWNGSYWLAGGRGTKTCSTSTDGMNWATTSGTVFTGMNDNVIDLAWNGSYWVAVGNNSTGTSYISISVDGLTWYPSSSDPFNGGGTGYGIAWNGSYFVMGGRATTATNKNIATSKNFPLQAITVQV